GTCEAALHLFLRMRRDERRVKHLRHPHVRREPHTGHGHVADARVLDLARDQLREYALQLRLDLALPPGAALLHRHDPARPELFQGPGHLETRKALDLIADAHVLVVLHTDAALRPGAHLADVVLEAAQRFQRALEDDDVVAQQANRIVAPDITLCHKAEGDDAELAGPEPLPNLSSALDLSIALRPKNPSHHL